jgi:general secretion pathway protein A
VFFEYYGLGEQPFGVTPDPRFLYFGTSHREALASLYCGVESGRGFLALIAKPGMGKTTLLFQLLNKLRDSASTAFLFQTQCDSRQLVRSVITDLGVETSETDDLFHLQNQLNAILVRESLAGRRFIMVVDEAQNLDESVLETLRMLSNFETPRAKLMQIILAGQPQLGVKLAGERMIQLRQRVSVLTRLFPLSPTETVEYVQHRLMVAGYAGDPLFSSNALELIASASEGIPRNINNLCFHALTLGFAQRERRVSASMVSEVLADLDLKTDASDVVTNKTDCVRQVAPPVFSPYRNLKWPDLGKPSGIAWISAATKKCVKWLSTPVGTHRVRFRTTNRSASSEVIEGKRAFAAGLRSRVRGVSATILLWGMILAWPSPESRDSDLREKTAIPAMQIAALSADAAVQPGSPLQAPVTANTETKRPRRVAVPVNARRKTLNDQLVPGISSSESLDLRSFDDRLTLNRFRPEGPRNKFARGWSSLGDVQCISGKSVDGVWSRCSRRPLSGPLGLNSGPFLRTAQRKRHESSDF